ncbi:MAG: hypothetical protein ABIH83_00940 [Candidatus Micrarchaeota archaeon]
MFDSINDICLGAWIVFLIFLIILFINKRRIEKNNNPLMQILSSCMSIIEVLLVAKKYWIKRKENTLSFFLIGIVLMILASVYVLITITNSADRLLAVMITSAVAFMGIIKVIIKEYE